MDMTIEPTQHYEYSIPLNSPWLHFERPTWSTLEGDKACEVVIVGAGISGVATLYYMLTQTEKQVVLLDQGRVASGATGNNAGLACLHIERSIQELTEEFGLEETRRAYREVDQGWELMLSILETIDAQEILVPLMNIALGMSSIDVLIDQLRQESYNREFERSKWQFLAVNDPEIKKAIPPDLKADVQFVPREEVLKTLQIVDRDFVGVAVPIQNVRLGRFNSAKFCYKVIEYLTYHYADRFSVYEHTPISSIAQLASGYLLKHPKGEIRAEDVVLCTNGYKNFEIRALSGERIHKLQEGIIPREGYLAAFVDHSRQTHAEAFFDDRGVYPDSPYFYISHSSMPGESSTHLAILGGPEFDQADGQHTNDVIAKRANMSRAIYRSFIKNMYGSKEKDFAFFWYGIMGYTSNSLRWVGEDPELKHLWYNLGCNGIGIIPAIGGGEKLSRLIQGQQLPPSIFDPS